MQIDCARCPLAEECEVNVVMTLFALLDAMHPRVTALADGGNLGLLAVQETFSPVPRVRTTRPVEELARYKCLDPGMQLCTPLPPTAA